MLIIVPVGHAPSPTYTCGICGSVMNEVGECPRCKLQAIELEREVQRATWASINECSSYFRKRD
jgi:hypothetical protein